MSPGPKQLLDRPVAEVLGGVPGALEAFRRAGMGACLGCAMAPFETVGEAARVLGVDPRRVLRELGRRRRGRR